MERAIKSIALIRAKHLAESVTTPVLLADGEGNMIFFNEAAEELLARRQLAGGLRAVARETGHVGQDLRGAGDDYAHVRRPSAG